MYKLSNFKKKQFTHILWELDRVDNQADELKHNCQQTTNAITFQIFFLITMSDKL